MSVLELIPGRKKKPAATPSARPTISVPRYRPPVVASPHPVPGGLARKLHDLRVRWRKVRVGERLAQGVAAGLILLAVQMALDWLVDLPFFVRLLLFGGDVALLVYFVRTQLLPPWLHPPDQDACALLVEKHWPRFRGRIIAAVQFAAPRMGSDSSALVQALQQEAENATGGVDFRDIVPTRPLKRRVRLAALVAALWIAGFVLGAPGSVALLERVFLLPAKVPRKTDVVCLSGNKIVPQGDSVVLEAQARGIVPSHGRITLTSSSGRIQEITLDPEPGRPDHFSLKLDKVEESLTYVIRLNDGSSGDYEVKAVPRPNVTAIDCEQVYPPYTGLGTVKRAVANLALLAGSKLQIHATANSKIVKASLKLAGLDRSLPLAIGGANGDDLTGEIDIPAANLTGFSIELTNQAGITSGDETQYRIDVIPDRPPTVELNKPEALQVLCTLKAKPDIAFTASDDYGLARVALCFRPVLADSAAATDASGNPVPPPAPQRIDMDLAGKHPLNLQALYTFDLAAVQPPLAEGTSIEYWMEAQDANDVTGPGIGQSEHHVIKIVSEMEKKAEIMDRLLTGLSTLNGISGDQETINKDLYQIIQGKPAETPAAAPGSK